MGAYHSKDVPLKDRIRPGDWECPTCGLNVFASKSVCFKCGTPKESTRESRKGDHKGYHKGHKDNDGYGEIMTIFVVNLPYDSEENEIRTEFEKFCGRRALVRIILQWKHNLCSAFIRFSAGKFARRALEDIEDGEILIRGGAIRGEMARRNS